MVVVSSYVVGESPQILCFAADILVKKNLERDCKKIHKLCETTRWGTKNDGKAPPTIFKREFSWNSSDLRKTGRRKGRGRTLKSDNFGQKSRKRTSPSLRRESAAHINGTNFWAKPNQLRSLKELSEYTSGKLRWTSSRFRILPAIKDLYAGKNSFVKLKLLSDTHDTQTVRMKTGHNSCRNLQIATKKQMLTYASKLESVMESWTHWSKGRFYGGENDKLETYGI